MAMIARSGTIPTEDLSKIYVGNLNEGVTKQQIEEMLKGHGATEVWVSDPIDYAFATFKTEFDAKCARGDLDGVTWKGCKLKVSEYKPKRYKGVNYNLPANK